MNNENDVEESIVFKNQNIFYLKFKMSKIQVYMKLKKKFLERFEKKSVQFLR